MGNLFSRNKQYKVFLIGLENSGKTTLLYQIKSNIVIDTAPFPKSGFNLEEITYENKKFNIWDISGRDHKFRLYRHYFQDADVVLFVLDSVDKEGLTEASNSLIELFNDPNLSNALILVLCNKQDDPNALKPSEIKERLNQSDKIIKSPHRWDVLPISAVNGTGINEMFDYLCKELM